MFVRCTVCVCVIKSVCFLGCRVRALCDRVRDGVSVFDEVCLGDGVTLFVFI